MEPHSNKHHKIIEHDAPAGDVEPELESPEPSSEPEPEPSPYAARPAEQRAEIPARQDHDKLRLATFSMVQSGVTLEEAAERYGVDPDALHLWHRTYIGFLGKESAAVSGTAPRERIEFDDASNRRFDLNWDEMMRIAELERPQLSPMRKRLLSSPLTRWMFRGEKIDIVTVSGAVAVLAFSALAIRAGASYRGKNAPPEITDQSSASVAAAAPELDPKAPSTFDAAHQRAILDKVTKALDAFVRLETWQERLPFVRERDSTAALMEKYYQDVPDGPITDLMIDPGASFINREDGFFVLLQGTMYDGDEASGQPPKRLIFLAEVTEEEPGVLFDWPVLVNYEPVAWPDFMAAKSATPSPFRVRLARGDYYNQPFMDPSEFSCYEMRVLHREKKIYGFVPRGSELAAKIEDYLSRELTGSRAMILNLRYPEKAKFDNILEIESVEADGWLGE